MQINTLWRVVRTLIVTYVISAVLLAALSFALFQFHLREPEVNAAVNAVYILSCLFGGLIAGKTMKTRRFLWGLLIGLLSLSVLHVHGPKRRHDGGTHPSPLRTGHVRSQRNGRRNDQLKRAPGTDSQAPFSRRVFAIRGHLFPGQTSCPVFYLFPNFASR